KPAGVSQYRVGWREASPLTELLWNNSATTKIAGSYTVADGQTQTVTVSGIPSGTRVFLAVKSLNAGGEASALSNSVEGATLPWSQITLRNGPAAPGMPAYAGTEACYLDGMHPQTAMSAQQPAARLEVRAAPAGSAKVMLIRFKDIPALGGTLQRAVLELTTDPSLQPNPSQLQGAAMLAMSVNAIRNDWTAGTASWSWGQGNELEAGGTFLSKAWPQFTVVQRRTMAWDVTAALQAAIGEGRNYLSLLVRADDTGKYIHGLGYAFCGPGWSDTELRPRLRITKQ
ncbi:MAG TPA: hypothetical protein PLZ36_08505, partial [Armatimonadota bacterium]|nr:hypothetical protein [Armatimonadota bacterium]